MRRQVRKERFRIMSEIKITKDNFEAEVLKAEQPVLLDFWAAWCGSCRMLSPVLTQLAEKQGGRVKIGRVNIDEEPALAERFRVKSIPLLAVLQNGKIVRRAVGYMPLEELEALLA